MRTFAAKLGSGESFLGVALAQKEIEHLQSGGPITLDLQDVGIGLWTKNEEDGSREFLQPRDSKIVVLPGDSKEKISSFLGIELPESLCDE